MALDFYDEEGNQWIQPDIGKAYKTGKKLFYRPDDTIQTGTSCSNVFEFLNRVEITRG